MPRNTSVKLKITPLQFEKKMIDQAHMSHVPVQLYIQKKNGVGGHTINCLISNPAFEEAEMQEGEGFTHNTPADTEMRRCIDDCMEKRHARVRASKMAGTGHKHHKKHLFGKKLRKGLKTASNISQGAALGLAMTPGLEEFAPVAEGVALGTSALSGAGHKRKKPRYALKAKKNSMNC